MSKVADNFRAIHEAKDHHAKTCPFPPHTLLMNPHDVQRMCWEDGDSVMGLVLKAEPKQQLDTFGLLCDGQSPPALDEDEAARILEDTKARDPELVPVTSCCS